MNYEKSQRGNFKNVLCSMRRGKPVHFTVELYIKKDLGEDMKLKIFIQENFN